MRIYVYDVLVFNTTLIGGMTAVTDRSSFEPRLVQLHSFIGYHSQLSMTGRRWLGFSDNPPSFRDNVGMSWFEPVGCENTGQASIHPN